MMSQWQYKHDGKTKDFVAHVSTPSISPWRDTIWVMAETSKKVQDASVNQNKGYFLCLSGSIIANACSQLHILECSK